MACLVNFLFHSGPLSCGSLSDHHISLQLQTRDILLPDPPWALGLLPWKDSISYFWFRTRLLAFGICSISRPERNIFEIYGYVYVNVFFLLGSPVLEDSAQEFRCSVQGYIILVIRLSCFK